MPNEEPTCVEIQCSREALEGKIETVAIELTLLLSDLRKVSDKVRVAEGSLVDLQAEVGSLEKQVAAVTSTARVLKVRVEDAERRSHRNIVRLLGSQSRSQ